MKNSHVVALVIIALFVGDAEGILRSRKPLKRQQEFNRLQTMKIEAMTDLFNAAEIEYIPNEDIEQFNIRKKFIQMIEQSI